LKKSFKQALDLPAPTTTTKSSGTETKTQNAPNLQIIYSNSPEVVKLLLPTSLYSIPARKKKKTTTTTTRRKHKYKSEKKGSLLQVVLARAAADKGRSAYHRTCTYH
jgi:hypothetical protein